MVRYTMLLLMGTLITVSSFAQSKMAISKLIDQKKAEGKEFQNVDLFEKMDDSQLTYRADFPFESFRLNAQSMKSLVQSGAETIELGLNYEDQKLQLQLVEVDILATDFKISTSSGNLNYTDFKARFYRGVVKSQPNSVVALTFTEDDVIGVIDLEGEENLVIGALSDTPRFKEFVLFDINKLGEIEDVGCNMEVIEELSNHIQDSRNNIDTRNTNCVNVYFECEHSMFLEEGSVTATVNQMTGIFNVVATLYANDQMTLNISEIKVWDTPDNYATGPSTADALYDFRSKVPSFNGDLAHLVSRGSPSGGGVAFLGGLCNSYSYGYSYIYSSYSQFPTYSWTVNVIAHELGHNLSSNHTHDCVWNGNNTAIDGCGPAAGYSGSGSCSTAPLPSNGGTIMSYCHLLGSVGINWNNGFGSQPATRMRNYIANASCLSSCGPCVDEGLACNDGDPCTSNDVFDANCNCVGIPEPDSDGDGVCDAEDVCPSFDDGLIGTACTDGDNCTINDVYTTNCQCEGTYADSDNDGVCDGEDICPGFDDNADADNDGIPDGCDLDCTTTSGSFDVNPLSHSGSGSSPSSIVFAKTSRAVSFTISGLNSKLSGNPNSRYDETVSVTYVDENNTTQTYGTRSGSQSANYSVSIPGIVKSVTVRLYDGYDGNANGLSVNLSAVDYCEDDAVCVSPDSDGDGVCDAEDVCPGFDDGVDSDGDGTPDGCDNCNDYSSSFPSSPLSHSGTGNSSTTSSFGQLVSDVQFSITGLGQRTNGKGSRRFIEIVTVTYTDATNTTQTYGTFSGASVSSVSVSIAAATSVTVELKDGLDGDTEEATLSVDLSTISGCTGVAAAPLAGSPMANNFSEWNIYPNPARDVLTIHYQNEDSKADKLNVRFFDLSGKMVKEQRFGFSAKQLNEQVNIHDLLPSVYFVQLQDGKKIVNKKLVILAR